MPRVDRHNWTLGRLHKARQTTHRVGHVKHSASYNKIISDRDSLESLDSGPTNVVTGRIVCDADCLERSVTSNLICKDCHSASFRLIERPEFRQGWCQSLGWQCDNQSCPRNLTWQATSGRNGGDGYDINKAMVLGFRAIGKGRAGAQMLSSYLDIKPPIHIASWGNHTQKLGSKVELALDKEFEQQAQQIRNVLILQGKYVDTDQLMDCAVTVDGSWLTRGFNSRHGVVTVISVDTGAVLDRHYLCSSCIQCSKWENKPHGTEYDDFIISHFENCTLNHEGSAASMEKEGARILFNRSINNNKLRYNPFIGDGDSKAFSAIVEDAPYGEDFPYEKDNCVGHVQKRSGTRLRDIVNKYRGQKLADGKGVGGRGRLSQKRIDSIQVFYGMALRSNKGYPEKMARATRAIFKHYSANKEHPEKYTEIHADCPDGPDSWCKFKSGKEYHPPKFPIVPAIMKIIQPVIDDLSDIRLMTSCQRGLTQNSNESLHHVIWSLVPKESRHSPHEVKLGIDMAILKFNGGVMKASTRIFEEIGMEMGTNANTGFHTIDNHRVKCGERSIQEDSRKSRRIARASKLDQNEAFEKDYSSGDFLISKETKRKKPICRKCGLAMHGHPKGRC